MTNFSTPDLTLTPSGLALTDKAADAADTTPHPRRMTLDRIKQFARVYTCLAATLPTAGVVLN